MFAEHIIYSAALAILVGMVFYKYTGRDSSWIIILFAFVPDLDYITGHHGTFHNIGVMVIFGIAMAFLLHPLGIKFFDSLFFSIIGFGAHLFEDALVYKVGYMFLWPLSSQILGIGLFPDILNEDYYTKDFFGIANTEVLIIGLVLLLTAFLIRTYYEGSLSWLRWYLPDRVYRAVFVPQNR